MVMGGGASRSHTASPSRTAARQARDDDAEERNNGIDDCSAGGSDGANDRHDGVAYRAEDGLDTRYDGAHFERLWGDVSGCLGRIGVVDGLMCVEML